MKFGLCAWSFSNAHAKAGRSPDPMTPMGLAALAAAQGLEAVEVAAAWFAHQGPTPVEAFVAETQAKKLSVVVDTGGTEVPAEIGDGLRAALATAERLGARVVRTTISRCLEGDRSRYGYAGWKEHVAGLVGPLKDAAARAGDAGMVIGIENHQDICSSELVWLCEQVGHPSLGVVMDCGNALAVGEEPATFAERVLPHLKHVHLKDYMVFPSPSGWRFVRCPLGEGVVDFRDLLTRFEAGAPGVLGCIELGATSARHVRMLEASWWETFDPRPWEENLAAIRTLHCGEKSWDADWRTPHERGEPPEAIVAYEIDQFEASVAFLRGLS